MACKGFNGNQKKGCYQFDNPVYKNKKRGGIHLLIYLFLDATTRIIPATSAAPPA